MDASDRLVWLNGNLVVPIEPYLLMFELEERGFSLSRDDDVLVVRPHKSLTADDCERIRRWKRHRWRSWTTSRRWSRNDRVSAEAYKIFTLRGKVHQPCRGTSVC